MFPLYQVATFILAVWAISTKEHDFVTTSAIATASIARVLLPLVYGSTLEPWDNFLLKAGWDPNVARCVCAFANPPSVATRITEHTKRIVAAVRTPEQDGESKRNLRLNGIVVLGSCFALPRPSCGSRKPGQKMIRRKEIENSGHPKSTDYRQHSPRTLLYHRRL
jgi:hypothetical protein